MVMQRFDPFIELKQMQDTLGRIWRGAGSSPTADGDMETWAIPLDVAEEGDNFVVKASLPGVHPDDIKVHIEDNVLTIRGHTSSEHEHKDGNYLMHERRTGNFYRALRLPDSVDTDKGTPYYENGVLTISIPKAESKKAKELKMAAVGKSVNGERS